MSASDDHRARIPDARPRPDRIPGGTCGATTTAHGSSGTSPPTISCGRNSRSWSPILLFASPDSIPSLVRWTQKRRCSGFTVTRDSPRTRRRTRRTSAPRSGTARSAGRHRAITSASTMQELCSSAAASIDPIHRSCSASAVTSRRSRRRCRGCCVTGGSRQPTVVSKTRTRSRGRRRASRPTLRTSTRSSTATSSAAPRSTSRSHPPHDLPRDIAGYFRDLLPLMTWLRGAIGTKTK